MLDCFFSPATKVFSGATHMPAKMLAAPYDSTMLDLMTHGRAGSFHLAAAFLHLGAAAVVVSVLCINRDHAEGQDQRCYHQELHYLLSHNYPPQRSKVSRPANSGTTENGARELDSLGV